jgi:hypothetical protein
VESERPHDIGLHAWQRFRRSKVMKLGSKREREREREQNLCRTREVPYHRQRTINNIVARGPGSWGGKSTVPSPAKSSTISKSSHSLPPRDRTVGGLVSRDDPVPALGSRGLCDVISVVAVCVVRCSSLSSTHFRCLQCDDQVSAFASCGLRW